MDNSSTSLWTKHIDPTTNRSYYYNEETEETRWEELSTISFHVDKTSNRRYSYNEITLESKWLDEDVLDTLERATVGRPCVGEVGAGRATARAALRRSAPLRWCRR